MEQSEAEARARALVGRVEDMWWMVEALVDESVPRDMTLEEFDLVAKEVIKIVRERFSS